MLNLYRRVVVVDYRYVLANAICLSVVVATLKSIVHTVRSVVAGHRLQRERSKAVLGHVLRWSDVMVEVDCSALLWLSFISATVSEDWLHLGFALNGSGIDFKILVH